MVNVNVQIAQNFLTIYKATCTMLIISLGD